MNTDGGGKIMDLGIDDDFHIYFEGIVIICAYFEYVICYTLY